MSAEAPSQEVEKVDPIMSLARKSLYDEMDNQQLAMLKATRMSTLSDPEVGVALEMCRTMGLNPWNDEMYAAKGNSGELLLMVGRNGLLRKAEEFSDYRGYESGIVYEGDVLRRVAPEPDGRTLRERAGVIFEQNLMKRGKCVGSWAVAERAGRPPRFFFAPIEDYRPGNAHPKSSWSRYPTVMIEKCAISVVHRTLTNLSGVYLREEVDKLLERADGQPTVITIEEQWASIVEVVRESEADAETQERLLAAMAALNELSPGSWGLGKVQMVIPGRSGAELSEQAEEIERDIAGHAPVPVAEPEEEITDAEVVQEPAEQPEAPAEGSGDPSRREHLEMALEDLRAQADDGELSEKARAEAATRIAAVEAELAQLPDVS